MLTMRPLAIGTRGSALALWQTRHVIDRLLALTPGLPPEWLAVREIHTEGDVVTDRPLSEIGGAGVFVKEIERALHAGEIDLAVHSVKDMPAELPEGLVLAAVLERADPRDALVVRDGQGGLASLPAGACVGTSSLRRRAQVLALRPDLRVADLRGNVDTRLRKLERGDYDAIVLASAGLIRLGRAAAITELFPLEVMLPAPGQGALGIEVRASDETTRLLAAQLDHPPTHQAVTAERAFLHALGSGCQAPVAAYAHVTGDHLTLLGLVAAFDGATVVRDEIHGPAAQAGYLGAALAHRLQSASDFLLPLSEKGWG